MGKIMRKVLLELWFLIYSGALLPSWFLALLIHWRESPQFVFVSPLEYARHSRSTLNAFIASVCWFVVISAIEALYKHL
jgi:formate/nitrite transporter FocA (FNT family)